MYWQVEATSDSGSVMMFGLEAVDRESALVAAIGKVPFPASSENVVLFGSLLEVGTWRVTVTEVPSPSSRHGDDGSTVA